MADRNAIYSLFLLALIGFKVSSATIHFSLHHNNQHNHHCTDDHEPGHDHKEECDLCEQALSILIEEFPTLLEVAFLGGIFQNNYNPRPENYKRSRSLSFLMDTHFVRPPPIPTS